MFWPVTPLLARFDFALSLHHQKHSFLFKFVPNGWARNDHSFSFRFPLATNWRSFEVFIVIYMSLSMNCLFVSVSNFFSGLVFFSYRLEGIFWWVAALRLFLSPGTCFGFFCCLSFYMGMDLPVLDVSREWNYKYMRDLRGLASLIQHVFRVHLGCIMLPVLHSFLRLNNISLNQYHS